MIHNEHRIGNFTSSEIAALMKSGKGALGFGAAAITYIEETNMERRLCRSLTDETNARPLTWGKLLEVKAFEQLGLEYTLTSKETVLHPEIKYWSGSPDGRKEDTVIDIKCPMTLKSFCQLVDCKNIDEVREKHTSGEKYYWQIVSNAILTGAKFGELIVYMPYKSELEDIKLMAQQVDASELSKHYWIGMANDDELPYILDGGYYKNINIIRFEIPQSDKDALTAAVKKAGSMLNGNEQVIEEITYANASKPTL